MAGVETSSETAPGVAAGADGAAYPSRRRLSTQKRPLGRYVYKTSGAKADTRTPVDGVGRPPLPARRRETVLAAVDDPWRNPLEEAPKRVEVAVNSKVDLLETERSHKHLSEAAYRTGRLVQAVFERAGRLGSTNWAGTSPTDRMLVQETNVVRNLDAACAIARLEARIRDRLGMIDTRLLRRILGDRLSYAECAGLQGKSGDRGERYIRQRFREALEDLAEAFAAKGVARPAPDDVHKAAAEAAPQRQVAAIAGGATRRRYEGELEAAREDAATAPTPRERRLAASDALDLETRLAWLGGAEAEA